MQTESNEPIVNEYEKNYESFDRSSYGERELRSEYSKKPQFTFGNIFLDEVFDGFSESDLILFGAKSGVGKSQLAMLIAIENALAGKRVVYYALEADRYEIHRRIKYQMIWNVIRSDFSEFDGSRLNYQDWAKGRLLGGMDKIEDAVHLKTQQLNNLRIFYRDFKEFNKTTFKNEIIFVKDKFDLIICDHLQYFDLEGDNENKETKEILKTIRDLVLMYQKPIVLISHIRKSDRKVKTVCPDIEDFHGSSDIGKIATKAFSMAPVYSKETKDLNKQGTLFKVLKNRVNGQQVNYVGEVTFDFVNQSYDPKYTLGKTFSSDQEFESVPLDKLPIWAKSEERRK